MKMLTIVAGLVTMALVGCKSRSSRTDSKVKDIESISSGGMNAGGQRTFVVQCAEGWVHVIAGQETKRVTITEDEMNQGNITSRYCTTRVNTSGGGGTGGGGGNVPPPGPQGLASIPTGIYSKIRGPAPCSVAQYLPILQSNVLRRVEFSCANSLFNGFYICTDSMTCKKGDDTITYYDDRFELETSSGQISSFALNGTVTPSYQVITFDNYNCSSFFSSLTLNVNPKNLAETQGAVMETFCRNIAPNEVRAKISGWKFNNGNCIGLTPGYPHTHASAVEFCLNQVAPMVKSAFETWLNTP